MHQYVSHSHTLVFGLLDSNDLLSSNLKVSKQVAVQPIYNRKVDSLVPEELKESELIQNTHNLAGLVRDEQSMNPASQRLDCPIEGRIDG